MHNLWEEMLPFYIAGSLAKPEATRLEHHLEHCAACNQSLNDWRVIAAAVRAEAASQMRALPPLSGEVLRAARERMNSRAYQIAEVPRTAQPRRSSERQNLPAVTMAAAAFTVLLIGGVLALMLLTARQQRGAENVALLPTSTATMTMGAPTETPVPQASPQIIVIEPSATPIVPTELPPTLPAPTSIAPPTQMQMNNAQFPTQMSASQSQTLPTFAPPVSATPGFEQALSQMSLAAGADCTAQAIIPNGSVINLYARPRTDATILTTISSADALVALATSDNSWYQVQSSRGNVGWVQQGLVSASGNCEGLPLIAAEDATDVVATPTETVLPFPTLEPTAEGSTSGNVPPEGASTATV